MKISCLLATGLAASALLLTSCGDKKGDDATKGSGSGGAKTSGVVSEKEALAALRVQAADLKAFAAAGKDEKDPMAGIALVKPMLAKMQAIKTEGLPADLKEALETAKSKVAEMAAVFKDMPEKKEEIMAWAQKTFTDPAIAAKMESIGKEVKESGEKLTEVAKKYDVDMDLK